MFIVSFIKKPKIIKKILKYLNLWEVKSSRGPPAQTGIEEEISQTSRYAFGKIETG